MPTTLELLAKPALTALREILAPCLASGVKPEYFKLDAMTPGADRSAVARWSLDRTNAPVQYWGCTDPVDFTYQRVDLANLFALLGTDIPIAFPTDTTTILRQALAARGLNWSDVTVQNQAVTGPGTVDVVLAPDNLVLYGQAQVTLRYLPTALPKVIVDTVQPFFADQYPDESINPRTRITAELNRRYGAAMPRLLTPGDWTSSPPTVLSEYSTPDNTGLTLTGVGDVFYGSVDIHYHRRNFAWMNDGIPLEINGPRQPSTTFLAAQIQSITGMYFPVTELVVDSYRQLALGETATLTLYINPTSLLYVGEITVNYTAVA